MGGIFLRFTEDAGVLRLAGAVFVMYSSLQGLHSLSTTRPVFGSDERGENHKGFSLINSFNSFPALK
jgi:hypothetical protein